MACGAFCLISLACGAFCFMKTIWPAAPLFHKIIRGCISFEVFYSVYQFSEVKAIGTIILSHHNDTICNQTVIRKCQITHSWWNQTSWDTNRTTPFQFQNNLLETTYVNTCNITMTNTRLIYFLLRLHAVSSHLLLILWHSNGPEPKVHFFHPLLQHTVFLQP